MNDKTNFLLTPPLDSGESIIPLSSINQFLYCSRRAGLMYVEGVFTDNEHTVLGRQLHKEVDTSGYATIKGVTLLRALPVWSGQFGLSGKCDIVERHPDGTLFPVEFKKGRRRKFGNDDAQLCAQAICLEEMFGRSIHRGAIFYFKTKRRREVEFTEELRCLTKQVIRDMHQLLLEKVMPRAVHKPQCSECSLFGSCMPEVTSIPPALAKASQAVFDTDD